MLAILTVGLKKMLLHHKTTCKRSFDCVSLATFCLFSAVTDENLRP